MSVVPGPRSKVCERALASTVTSKFICISVVISRRNGHMHDSFQIPFRIPVGDIQTTQMNNASHNICQLS